MELVDSILNEISQVKKDKCCMFSHVGDYKVDLVEVDNRAKDVAQW